MTVVYARGAREGRLYVPNIRLTQAPKRLQALQFEPRRSSRRGHVTNLPQRSFELFGEGRYRPGVG